MDKLELPVDEPMRIEDLNALQVLDTSEEPAFDRIVRLAASIMDTPIAMVSLVDVNRQWFKAKVGLQTFETPRDQAFCRIAVMDDAPLIVEDATVDPRFSGSSLVTSDPCIRFYAGAPLILPSGRRMGALCALDRRPRKPTPGQISALTACAAIATDLLAMRRDLQEARAQLRDRSDGDDERKLALVRLSHDLRTPLNQMIGFAQMIEHETFGPAGHEKYREYGAIIRSSANHLFDMVDGVMRSELEALRQTRCARRLDLVPLLGEIVQSFGGMAAAREQRIAFEPGADEAIVRADATALRRVVINLVTNASRHCPDGATISLSLRPNSRGNGWLLQIADDGPGIPPDVLQRLGAVDAADVDQPRGEGFGLGLGIVARLCRAQDWPLRFDVGPEGGTRVFIGFDSAEAAGRPAPSQEALRALS